eukprot:1080828-Pleurochrysis_carterae.AAC.1
MHELVDGNGWREPHTSSVASRLGSTLPMDVESFACATGGESDLVATERLMPSGASTPSKAPREAQGPCKLS